MINKDTTIEVTIEVPIGDIEIVNLKVQHEKETRDTPASTDVSYDCIIVDKLPDEFKIINYEDNLIDQLGECRWAAGDIE